MGVCLSRVNKVSPEDARQLVVAEPGLGAHAGGKGAKLPLAPLLLQQLDVPSVSRMSFATDGFTDPDGGGPSTSQLSQVGGGMHELSPPRNGPRVNFAESASAALVDAASAAAWPQASAGAQRSSSAQLPDGLADGAHGGLADECLSVADAPDMVDLMATPSLHSKLNKSLRILSQVATRVQSGAWIIRQTANVRSTYTFGHKLARGEFGLVYTVKHNATGKRYACKCLAKKKLLTDADYLAVQREVQILHHLGGHASVVTLHDVFEDKKQVSLVLDRCQADLHDYLRAYKRLTEAEAAAVFDQLVRALQHCHSLGVLHRDVKPENFLLVDSRHPVRFKLTDFGLSTFYREGQRFTDILGSPFYLAPEVISKSYGREADVWSLGCILYQMIAGQPPFYADDDKAVFRLTQRATPDLASEPWPGISAEAKDLLERILVKAPHARITLQEIVSHPWLVMWRQRGPPPRRLPPGASATTSSKSLRTASTGSMAPDRDDDDTRDDGTGETVSGAVPPPAAAPSPAEVGLPASGNGSAAYRPEAAAMGSDQTPGQMQGAAAAAGSRGDGGGEGEAEAGGGGALLTSTTPGAARDTGCEGTDVAAAGAAAAVGQLRVLTRSITEASSCADDDAASVAGCTSVPRRALLGSHDTDAGAGVAAGQATSGVTWGPAVVAAPKPSLLRQSASSASYGGSGGAAEWEGLAAADAFECVLLQRLRQFAAAKPLRRAVLRLVAGLLPHECTVGHHNLFNDLDDDRSSRLDAAKLQRGMAKRGTHLDADEATRLLAAADLDGDGGLSIQEWMAATMWLPRVKLDVLLQEAFLQLDKDDDGLITVSELAAFLSATDLRAMLLREAPGSPCSNGAAGSVAALVSTTTASTAKEHAASLAACAIEEADTDGDSKLSLSEFVAAVTGTGGVPAPQPAAMLLPGAVPEQLV